MDANPYESPQSPSEPPPAPQPEAGSAVPLAIFLLGFEAILVYSLVDDAVKGFPSGWFQVMGWIARLGLTLLLISFSCVVFWRAARRRSTR